MGDIFSVGDRVAVNPYGLYKSQGYHTNGAIIQDIAGDPDWTWSTGTFMYDDKDLIPYDGE